MKTKILLGMVILLSGVVSYSFIAPSEPVVWEYMTVYQGSTFISISGTSQIFKEEKIKPQTAGDYNVSLKRVQELESHGWEMVVNNATSAPSTIYFLLRKKKE